MGLFSRFRHGGHKGSKSMDNIPHMIAYIDHSSRQVSASQRMPDVSDQIAPVECPAEPCVDELKPIRCPAPEPCIVHDGRIWKQLLSLRRKSGSFNRVRGGSMPMELQKVSNNTLEERDPMLTSFSAPEKSIVTMLD